MKEYYLEDALQITGYSPEPNSMYARKGAAGMPPRDAVYATPELRIAAIKECEDELFANKQLLSAGFKQKTVEALLRCEQEKINYDLVEKVLQKICLDGEEVRACTLRFPA